MGFFKAQMSFLFDLSSVLIYIRLSVYISHFHLYSPESITLCTKNSREFKSIQSKGHALFEGERIAKLRTSSFFDWFCF